MSKLPDNLTEDLLHALLDAFPYNTRHSSILTDFQSGHSGVPVLLVRFYSTDSRGLKGTYVVKIGRKAWAKREEAVYTERATGPLTPLLAPLMMRSRTIKGFVAVAYDVAFDRQTVFDPRTHTTLATVLESSQAEDEAARGYINDLSRALVEWYNAAGEARETELVSPYEVFVRMLGKRRQRDLRERIELRAPAWPQSAQHITVQADESHTISLPNPLAYLSPGDWERLQMVVHCPIGRIHGDLHTGNVILRSGGKENIRLIDFAESIPDGVPFFDLAYLEFDILRRTLPVVHAEARDEWVEFLEFAMRDILPENAPRDRTLERVWRFIRPVRKQVCHLQKVVGQRVRDPGWLGEEDGLAEGDLVWWIATVAVGLNFARKNVAGFTAYDRVASLLYAAYGLRNLFPTRRTYKDAPLIRWDVDVDTHEHPLSSLPRELQ